MKVSVIYASSSGNTKEVADIIQSKCSSVGAEVSLTSVTDFEGIKTACTGSDLIFFGTYTWGKGELPETTKESLRFMLKYNDFKLPPVAVFGTGETTFTYYCRAVDESAYHLSKKTEVLGRLKTEQRPSSPKQIKIIEEYSKAMIAELKGES